MHKVPYEIASMLYAANDCPVAETGMAINLVGTKVSPIRRTRFSGIIALAIGATTIATCMSVLSGSQRGGLLPERMVWVALNMMMVFCAHLLPVFCRTVTSVARLAATGIWMGCMVVVCYGHATFFLFSQQHAGERRAEAVTVMAVTSPPVTKSGRSPAEIATEIADYRAKLAANDARRCRTDCTALRVTHISLIAKLDALGVEVKEAKRREAAEDRQLARADRMETLRDLARDDPVTTRLTNWTGATTEQVSLLLGFFVATVLEGVACLCWYVALSDRVPETIATAGTTDEVARTTTTDRRPVVSGSATSGEETVLPDIGIEPDACLERLSRDIAAGLLRPTVADIRRHLHCSQARAVALRRQLET